jgi:hypothetical protein
MDDWAIGVQSLAKAVDFPLVSGADPASCPMGTMCLFPGGKARLQLGHDADHSPPSSAEVKYE